MKALEAKSFAQEIAFGPFSFHATLALRDTGLLAALDDAGADGVDLDALVQATGVPRYGIEVLLDFGSNLDLVERRENRYSLGKVGHFVLHDEMTRVNMDFTRDVCYSALPELTTSILESRPAGLNALGPWSTIYQGLTVLPETARESWFRFDHYYSDRAFGALLPIVFRHGVRRLLDVGGNTGRWALRCLAHDPDVRVTLMDLPGQGAFFPRLVSRLVSFKLPKGGSSALTDALARVITEAAFIVGGPLFLGSLALAVASLLLRYRDATVAERHGLKIADIELEITESALMLHPEKVSAVIHDLQATGVRNANDHLGTGYCSLAKLKTVMADVV
jgi:hypothetical protein